MCASVGYLGHSPGEEIRGLTVLCTDPGKDDVAPLVDLDVLDAVPAPLTKQDCHLLSGAPLGNVEAHMSHRRLDAEETGQPVLLDLDLAYPTVAVRPSAL